MVVSETNIWPAPLGTKRMPCAVPDWNPKMLHFSTCRDAPWMKLMPISPLPTPSISSPRRMTLAPAPLTLMPLVRAARTPAIVLVQSMVIDLVMVTAPNPPESRQLMMPRSEEHTSELQSLRHLVCRLLLEKKNNKN